MFQGRKANCTADSASPSESAGNTVHASPSLLSTEGAAGWAFGAGRWIPAEPSNWCIWSWRGGPARFGADLALAAALLSTALDCTALLSGCSTQWSCRTARSWLRWLNWFTWFGGGPMADVFAKAKWCHELERLSPTQELKPSEGALAIHVFKRAVIKSQRELAQEPGVKSRVRGVYPIQASIEHSMQLSVASHTLVGHGSRGVKTLKSSNCETSEISLT